MDSVNRCNLSAVVARRPEGEPFISCLKNGDTESEMGLGASEADGE